MVLTRQSTSARKETDLPMSSPPQAKSEELLGLPRYVKLPFHVQKQLAIDIESTPGGMAVIVGNPHLQLIEQICSHRPELYGLPESAQRAKVQKKVWYWRELFKQGKYNGRVLEPLGVPPHCSQQDEESGNDKENYCDDNKKNLSHHHHHQGMPKEKLVVPPKANHTCVEKCVDLSAAFSNLGISDKNTNSAVLSNNDPTLQMKTEYSTLLQKFFVAVAV